LPVIKKPRGLWQRGFLFGTGIFNDSKKQRPVATLQPAVVQINPVISYDLFSLLRRNGILRINGTQNNPSSRPASIMPYVLQIIGSELCDLSDHFALFGFIRELSADFPLRKYR
jgi:hypothetical protein